MLLAVTKIPENVGIQKQLTGIHIEEWLKEDVFRLKWWLLIGLILLFLFVWWKLSDKSRFNDICLFAAFAAIAAMAINEYGEELTLWDYPVDIIPIFPPLSSLNLLCFPLIYSIVFQYFRTWKSFIWAALAATAILCFALEPILEWTGFYHLLKWKHLYNFPIYIVIVLGIRALVNKLTEINKKHENIVSEKNIPLNDGAK